jgi:uncharacterized protein YozE (UPF0346 family)
MKAKILKYKWILVLAFLSSFHVNGAITSHTQRIIKKYKINDETRVYINNKYGKIHVSNWSKDSLEIEINLLIRSSNSTRVYKLKDNIDFDIVKTKYNITATTVFGSRYNSIFSDLINLAESFVSTENQVTIDYTIKAPLWANISIEHKYGDIFIDDSEGEMNIKLSNGELKANRLEGATIVTLSSADADIYHMKDGKVIITYADLNIKSANKLNINSKSSNVFLSDIEYLKVDSRRDKYYITTLDKSFGDTYFSDFSISELNREVSYDMSYGNMNIEKIARDFSLINLTSEYTDISILFDRHASYNFDMTHFNDIAFNYPKELSKLQEKLIDEEKSEFLVYGTIGPAENTNAKVNIKAFKKCYIRIEHK